MDIQDSKSNYRLKCRKSHCKYSVIIPSDSQPLQVTPTAGGVQERSRAVKIHTDQHFSKDHCKASLPGRLIMPCN